MDPITSWEDLEIEPVADCRVFQVERRRRRQAAEGTEGDFFLIRCPDWVNILAFTPKDELLLIRQWRHGVSAPSLEVPAGVIDPGERPLAAAKRELLEETGYAASRWFSLGSLEANPALQDNRCHCFLALDARPRQAQADDPRERILVEPTPYPEAERRWLSGQIRHGLAVAALGLEAARRAGRFDPEPLEAVAETHP